MLYTQCIAFNACMCVCGCVRIQEYKIFVMNTLGLVIIGTFIGTFNFLFSDIQWNLQITDTLGPANFTVIERLSSLRGKIVLP